MSLDSEAFISFMGRVLSGILGIWRGSPWMHRMDATYLESRPDLIEVQEFWKWCQQICKMHA